MEARSERSAWIPEPVFAEIGITDTLPGADERQAESLPETDGADALTLKSLDNTASEPETTISALTPLFPSSETIKFNVLTFLLTSEMSVLLSKITSF